MPEAKEIVEDENKISTVIADDIVFKGNLKFKDSLKIKGSFEGKIETEGHLIVGKDAKISADIKARLVSINGTVNGKINAAQKIKLYKKSKTNGDLITPDLLVEEGSSFNGVCIMDTKG